MPETRYSAIVLTLALIVTGCASTTPLLTSSPDGEALCSWQDVQLYINFDAGRVDQCDVGDEGFHLTILPEATPINPSPWYAFQLRSDSHQTVRLSLSYPGFKHRYPANISHDREHWSRLPRENIHINQDGDEAVLTIPLTRDPVYVSAQELVTKTDYQQWIEMSLGAFPFLTTTSLGNSVLGTEIIKLESPATTQNRQGTIMLVGRQHPPEVSGAFSFFAFAEELLGSSLLARRFRKSFSVVMVPVLNPDGVRAGNWRLNANGKDLNRDWGPFTEPETQLMRDELVRINDGGRDELALFLDFHSTFKNVIYTQTDDVQTRPHNFATRWHNAMINAGPDIGLLRQGSHNTDRPTSKAYVYKTYGTAAITVEMHENENRKTIREFSRMAAREMMKILLADNAKTTENQIGG